MYPRSVYFQLLSHTADHITFNTWPGILIFTMALEIVLLQKDLLAFSTLEFCHSFATFMNYPNMLKLVIPAG
jgi:hypothetical protein